MRRPPFYQLSFFLHYNLAELDSIISSIPHTHFITGPVFGPPSAAVKGDLILVLSGDYRSKKVVAHLSVPAMARKAMDLGGNIEKGLFTELSRSF